MLWDASALNGYAVDAQDGEGGTVRDIVFDPAGWAASALVVDTGSWLSRHTALLDPASFGLPDPASRRIATRLTLAEIAAAAKPAPEAGISPNRSLAALAACSVRATDGPIGHVADLLIDDSGWAIRYLVVAAGPWWSGNKVLLAPAAVTAIDWQNEVVHVGITRSVVQASPPFDPDTTVDRGYEHVLHGYYGWTAYF